MKSVFALLATILPAGAASAQTASDPKVVAQGVQQLFDRRCAECHDAHKAGGKAKGGFGFVLDFARMRSDPDYVNLSSPENSPIYRLLIDSDPESRMPQLTKTEKERGLSEPEPLPGTESALVLQWIQLGAPTPDGAGARELTATKPPAEPEKPASSVPDAPAPVAKRTPVREADATLELARDLRSQPEHDRAQVRYISILPQHNNTVEVSDAQLDVARNGVRKLLNSLSTNPKIATFAEVGPGKAFFRFKLEDLGWTAALWERIASFYPYGLEENDLGREAGSPVPILRADWLATNGTRPPLYHDILGLPATLDELNRKLGVDLVGNLQKFRALRAGFVASGISRFNRMIERHELGAWPGYYWLSYDFAGSNGQRDLLRNPLGPMRAQIAGGRREFEHDGGELIFSLPNGFQGYYLTNAAGGRLDIAPTSIVGDVGGVTGRPDIVNGLSCIICHSGGMKEQPGNKDAVTDQVRAVAGRGGFSAAEEEAILGLYREQKEVDAAIGEDRATFKAALAKAGVTQGSTEPISALALPFEERLTTARAAAELGLAADELERKLSERDDQGILRIQLGQRALPRDGFGEQFADVARRLGVGRVRMAGARLQGSVDVLRDEQEKKRPQQLLFELRTDKSMYRKDEPVNVTIFAQQEGHLRLFYKDAAGQVTTLFPSAAVEQQAKSRGVALDDRIPGGKPVVVSGKGSRTNITVFIDGPKFGREQLGAVLTDAPIEDDAEFRAELEKSGSMEVALSSIAVKSAVVRVNNPDARRAHGPARTPRLGVQIVNLHTVPR